MEAVVSPSAPAKAEAEVLDPRANLLQWYLVSPGCNGYSPPNPTAHTFCMCCGSQFINKEGKVGMAGTTWIKPTEEAGKEYYKERYGPDAENRFGKAEWQLMIAKFNRRNKPGVTISYLPLKDSIELLYDEDHRALAEGYEINDKEHGTLCVLWLNA